MAWLSERFNRNFVGLGSKPSALDNVTLVTEKKKKN